MIVAEREGHIDALEVLDGGHDVEHGELLDPVGKSMREAVRHARAAVVAADAEAPMAEALHHLHHVARHLRLGVGRVVAVASGLKEPP